MLKGLSGRWRIIMMNNARTPKRKTVTSVFNYHRVIHSHTKREAKESEKKEFLLLTLAWLASLLPAHGPPQSDLVAQRFWLPSWPCSFSSTLLLRQSFQKTTFLKWKRKRKEEEKEQLRLAPSYLHFIITETKLAISQFSFAPPDGHGREQRRQMKVEKIGLRCLRGSEMRA